MGLHGSRWGIYRDVRVGKTKITLAVKINQRVNRKS